MSEANVASVKDLTGSLTSALNDVLTQLSTNAVTTYNNYVTTMVPLMANYVALALANDPNAPEMLASLQGQARGTADALLIEEENAVKDLAVQSAISVALVATKFLLVAGTSLTL